MSERPVIEAALADLKETWAFTPEQLTHIAERLNGAYNSGASSERQPLSNLTVGETIAHAQRLCARLDVALTRLRNQEPT